MQHEVRYGVPGKHCHLLCDAVWLFDFAADMRGGGLHGAESERTSGYEHYAPVHSEVWGSVIKASDCGAKAQRNLRRRFVACAREPTGTTSFLTVETTYAASHGTISHSGH